MRPHSRPHTDSELSIKQIFRAFLKGSLATILHQHHLELQGAGEGRSRSRSRGEEEIYQGAHLGVRRLWSFGFSSPPSSLHLRGVSCSLSCISYCLHILPCWWWTRLPRSPGIRWTLGWTCLFGCLYLHLWYLVWLWFKLCVIYCLELHENSVVWFLGCTWSMTVALVLDTLSLEGNHVPIRRDHQVWVPLQPLGLNLHIVFDSS